MKAPKNFNFITEPYPYQLESFAFCIQRHNAGLLLDMGLGKTKVSIDVARYRIQKSKIKRVLVVCPPSIIYNWEKEVRLHSEYEPLIISHSNRDERMARLLNTDKKFNIINYESLFPTLRDLGIMFKITKNNKRKIYLENKAEEMVASLNYQMIIFDESARYIKNHVADRTQASILLADQAKYTLILTGTPISNRPMDIWSQFRALDGGMTFFDNFYMFRNYCFDEDTKSHWGGWILKKDKIEFLNRGIYHSCIRKRKDEVLEDLPSKIFQEIEVEFTRADRSIYNSLKVSLLKEIEVETEEGTKSLNINSVLTKLLRLQQVTSGFVKDKKEESVLKNTPKLDVLSEYVQSIIDQGESVVVFCRFRKTIDLIKERLHKLGIPCNTMDGRDTNQKERYKKWKGFQTSKTINVFVAQVESGGIGIELFKEESEAVQYMIFYENTWTLDVREQAIDRIHRIGQEAEKVVYIDLVVKNTIDEKVLNVLKSNKRVADSIVEQGSVKSWLD